MCKPTSVHSLVTANAGKDGAPVSAPSAAQVRWTDALAEAGGGNGDAGRRAKHAADRGDGSARTARAAVSDGQG